MERLLNTYQLPARFRQTSRGVYILFILVLGLGAVAFALTLLGHTNPARAGTICVKPGGGDGCEATISDALDLAQDGRILALQVTWVCG